MNVQALRVSISKHKKAIRIGIVTLLVIAVGVTSSVLFLFNSGGDSEELIPRSSTVTMGNIQSTITGSGTLTPANRVTLSSPGNTTITQLPFKVGDTVKKGQLIFALDDTQATQTVFQNQDSLSDSQSDLESKQESIKTLNITAPSDGVITNISVSQGDNIQGNAPVITLTNNSIYKLTVPFNNEDTSNIQIGDQATVYLQSLMSSVIGTVSYVGNSPYAASNGGKLRDVDIQIKNPGSLEEGLDATAEITKSGYSFSSTSSAKLVCKAKYSLKCEAGGTVKKVNVRQNQYVHKGQLLVSVENDDLVRSVKTGQSKLKTQQDQLKYSQEQKEKYVVYAPIDGEIVQQDYKLGDSVKQGDAVAVIADVSKMEFSVSIDELDIAKIKVGQQVNVTVDALTQTSFRPLSGVVSKIAPEGTSTNGVSTYPVTISVSSTYASNQGTMRGDGQQGSNGNGFGGFNRQSGGSNGNSGGSSGLSTSSGNAGGSSGQSSNSNSNSGRLSGQSNGSNGYPGGYYGNNGYGGNSSAWGDRRSSGYGASGTSDTGTANDTSSTSGSSNGSKSNATNVTTRTGAAKGVNSTNGNSKKNQSNVTGGTNSSKDTNGDSGVNSRNGNSGNGQTQGVNSGSSSPMGQRYQRGGQNSASNSQTSITLLSGMNANAEIIISGKSNVLTVPIEAVHRFNGKSYVIVKSTKSKVEKLKKQGKYVDIFTNQRSNSNTSNGYEQQSGAQRNNGNSNRSSGNNSYSGYGRNSGSSYGSGNSGSSRQSSYSSTNNEQLTEYYSTGIPTEIEVGVNNSLNIEVVSGLKEGQEIMLPPTIKTQTSTQNTNSSGMNGMNGFGGNSFGGGGFSGGMNGGFSGGNRNNRSSGSSGRN